MIVIRLVGSVSHFFYQTFTFNFITQGKTLTVNYVLISISCFYPDGLKF